MDITKGMTFEEMCDLKKGDKVRVLFKTGSYSYCPRSGKKWCCTWAEPMDSSVGKVLEVKEHDFLEELGAPLSGGYTYPWFCLELVEKVVIKELTISQISKLLGYEVKIVKDD